ncbi:MAG TPA: DnaB-like helicase C-terminal domain-containing protein [Candidatus Acidoferrales bacterium]|nr:DnaB-like helicase C-terminal domain-containing protein [Candidatus Acidoferrales bacterium]
MQRDKLYQEAALLQLPQSSFKNWTRDPPCITSLLRHGAPSDLGETDVNDLLVAYVVTRGLSDIQGEKLVQKMAQSAVTVNFTATDSIQMTMKAHALQQFKDRLAAARNNDEACHWDCTRLWANDKIRKRGACSGWTCPLYLSTASSAERLLPFTVADVQIERDLLTYVLNVPDGMDEAMQLDVPPEGFIAEHAFEDGTTLLLHRILWHLCRHIAAHDKEVRVSILLALLSKVDEEMIQQRLADISRYLDGLKSETPCRPDTFSVHLTQIRERWIRLRGKELIYNAYAALQSPNLPLEVTLETLKIQAQELQHAVNDGLPTIENGLIAFLKDFFTRRRRTIPSPSEWLNRTLSEGWQVGRVYVMCGPPYACTTDFCSWCADYAAHRRFPVLHVSYDTSREELGLRALARHSGIDAEQILKQALDAVDAGEMGTLQEQLLETAERLGRRIAPYLTDLEGDAETTIAVIRDLVNTIRHRPGRDVNDPVLVVIDSLQMMLAEGEQRCCTRFCTSNEIVGMRRILTLLKQFAREDKVAVLALFVLTESSYEEVIQTDTVTVREISSSLEGAHAVDSILLLRVGEVKVKDSPSEETIDQFHCAWDHYKRWFSQRHDHAVIDKCFSDALTSYPLDRYTSSYARISLLKNRDGILADPVVIYERPYHRFIPIDIDLTALEGDDDPSR